MVGWIIDEYKNKKQVNMNINKINTYATEAGERCVKKPHFYLSWYQSDGDDLIGQELLNVSEDTIRKWFWMQPDDLELDGLIVRSSQKKQLQECVQHQIDLNQFDYIIEYLFIYDNTI